ncbi:MAG TPA: phosphotransferase [Candidatus Saccharimonadales bacterium]|nr:phosphotransferase [Candidatus Saccharimonadales bacterium]
MNPETKATGKQIQEICRRYNIQYRFHSRVTVGFNHELHRLNDDLVIKIYNVHGEDDSKRFRLESALLAYDAPFLKPRLIASDDTRQLIDRDYVIMSFVPGKSLGSVWHLGSDEQREKVIKTICNSLKVINTLSLPGNNRSGQHDWGAMVRGRFEGYITNLLAKSIIDTQAAQKARIYFDKNSKTLSSSIVYPVYWDIHFDNFIVDDDFNLLAMIDLESVRLASLDYPLFTIQTMMNYPKSYLSEEGEKFANKVDYKNLKYWYQRYYPEMFRFDGLCKRIDLYMLLDTLHMLEDWSHVKRLYDELNRIIS